MKWDEVRWDDMKWDEARWDEVRWDENLNQNIESVFGLSLSGHLVLERNPSPSRYDLRHLAARSPEHLTK